MHAEGPEGAKGLDEAGDIATPVAKAIEAPSPLMAVPAAPTPAAPSPPPPPGGQLQVALGMQFMQPNALAALSPEVQRELVASMDRQDQRGYQHAMEQLKSDERVKCREMDDRTSARKLIVLIGAGLTLLGLCAGVWVTIYLLSVGQYQWAYTMMLAGFAVIASFIGGAGLGSHIRKFFSK